MRTASPCEGLESRVLFATDFVLDWNAVAIQAIADDHTPSVVASPEQGGPTRTARAMAIVHAAMFDALNSIGGKYEPYLIDLNAPRWASRGAAVSQAAHDTLAALYPSQADVFDDALQDSLGQLRDKKAKQAGVLIGKFVADAILDARANDGSDATIVYDEPVVPGVFQMFPGEPDPLTPQWGDVTPFTMTSGDQFLSDSPPALDSPEYAEAFNEVKNFGGDGDGTDTLRTEEQTQIGIYWGYDGAPGMGTPPRLYNQIARVIADQEHNSQAENARMFALINLTMADAGIASWGTKYEYNFWRPMRGIRQADAASNGMDDGNPDTEADPEWTPLGSPLSNVAGGMNFTPPFPAYTSGHATFGAALFQTLTRFYGTDDIAFTFVSDEMNGVTTGVDGVPRDLAPRSFNSFSQAMEENGQSRIYLGVHWAFDKTAGIEQGTSIANFACDNVLEYVRGNGNGNRHGHGNVVPVGPTRPNSDRKDVNRDDDDEGELIGE